MTHFGRRNKTSSMFASETESGDPIKGRPKLTGLSRRSQLVGALSAVILIVSVTVMTVVSKNRDASIAADLTGVVSATEDNPGVFGDLVDIAGPTDNEFSGLGVSGSVDDISSKEKDGDTKSDDTESADADQAEPAELAGSVEESQQAASPLLSKANKHNFGFSPGGWFPDVSDAELNRDLDQMVEVGATWLRIDFDWSHIEGRSGDYHWHRTDRVVDAADARGIKVLGIISQSPSWSRGPGTNSYSPPEDPADYARFAAAAAERYEGRGVEAWQLWNEPNLSIFWSPKPDPVRYARLVNPAIDAMRNVAPDVMIVSAGLAPAADAADGQSMHPKTFLNATLDAGATRFGAYGSHPYSFPARPLDPQSASWNPFIQLPELHQILKDRGLGGRQIWLTEYGAPTGTSSRAVSEAEQSGEVIDALVAAEDWGFVGPVFLYSHRDERHAPNDWLANMGLRRHDGTPKQAWNDLEKLNQN